MTHPTWLLPLSDNAGLVLTPCPGTKGTSLEASIAQLKEEGVTIVVTAINQQEMAEKNVTALPDVVQQAGLQWFHAPIEDDCAPDADFLNHWTEFSSQLQQALNNGEKIALHCMGGSGRTGLLAAHILLEQHWPIEKIIADVQALRPGAFTKPLQVDYIQQWARA